MNKGKIELSFQIDVTKNSMSIEDESKYVKVVLDDNCQSQSYKFMNETIKQIVEVLDTHLKAFGIAFIKEFKFENVVNSFDYFQNSVVIIGRICSEASDGKMNESSVLLEIPSHSSKRIKLHLRDLPEFSVFPGQVSFF